MRLFISYSRADSARARSLAKTLNDLGHDVFIDQKTEVGAEYRNRLEEEIKNAEAVIVIWTKDSIRSQWVREEAEAARMAGKLLPLTIGGIDPPFGFREIQTPEFPLLADGASIASRLNLGGSPAPDKQVVDRSSPVTWHERPGIAQRLLQWATRDR